MADLPIVCTLTPDALRARREGLQSGLLRQADDHEQLLEGLRLRSTPTSETLDADRGGRRPEVSFDIESRTRCAALSTRRLRCG